MALILSRSVFTMPGPEPGGQDRRLALSRIAPSRVKIDPSPLSDDGRVFPMRANSYSNFAAGARQFTSAGKRPSE